MITAKLQAGLCNQMFMISAATALAKRNNDKVVFDINKCHTPNQGNVALKYKDTVYRDLPLGEIDGSNVYTEESLKFKEIPYVPGLMLDGYFQSEQYFADFADDIKKLFSIFYEGTNEYADYTAVCVRRGDYVTKFAHIYPLPTISYYRNAMDIIGKEEKFMFFADDMQWCRDKFQGDNIIYCPFIDDVEQLQALTKCKNKILCNSTFGWWGAWLGENENSKIIAPDIWFTPESGLDASTILPERWTKIPGGLVAGGGQDGDNAGYHPGILT